MILKSYNARVQLPHPSATSQQNDSQPTPALRSPWLARYVLPVAVPLGVTLPGIGHADTIIGNSTTTVSLANYGAGNPFYVTSGTNVTVTSGLAAVYGSPGTAWTITNAGTISASANVRGISLGSGTIVNQGIISSDAQAVYITGSGASFTNSGTIGSTGGDAVTFLDSGTVSNSGTQARITGSLNGVDIAGSGTVSNDGTISGSLNGVLAGGGTVSNNGVISGTTGAGVSQTASGSITNNGGASIIGAIGVQQQTAGSTLNNSGTITGTGGAGVISEGGAIGNNGTLAKISGLTDGIQVSSGSVAITNKGEISGGTGSGINLSLTGASSISNSGHITGVTTGILVSGSTATITNTGVISGTGANGVGVAFTGTASGTIDNFGTISGASGTAVQFSNGTNELIIESGGVLQGVADGGVNGNSTLVLRGTGSLSDAQIVNFESTQFEGTTSIDSHTSVTDVVVGNGGSISNSGTISGSLSVTGGGTLSNAGTISLTIPSTNSGTLTNTGTITSTSVFTSTGSLHNNGTIVGSGTGVVASGSVQNSETIIGGTTGVYLGGGSLTNASGGFIQGGDYGIMVGSGGSVINAGTILDDHIAGASLGSNSTINNTGRISGSTGALFTGTGATLNNSGTIAGTGGVAVQFDTGVNTLNLGTGSVLDGSIDGGGGAGQIVLTGSGTMSNTIANFGVGSALNIATGANWVASGNWTIGSVSNAGQFTAGTLSAPLHLTGNFAQTSAGTFNYTIGNGSPFTITGTASLAGGLALASAGSMLTAGTQYTILSASNGVNGTFGTVTASLALLSPTVAYNIDNVVVSFSQLPVASAAIHAGTPNQLATARAFDQASAVNPALMNAALAGLDQLSAGGVRDALNRISGENHADLPTIALMAGRQFADQVGQQTVSARGIDSGTSGGQATMMASGRQQFATASGAASTDAMDNLVLPWGVWSSAYGQTGHLGGDGNASGLTESVGGIAVGTDYKVNPALRIGVALGHGQTAFTLNDGGGAGNVGYTQIGVYGDYGQGPAYVHGLVGFAHGDGTTTRDVSLPGLPGSAHADVTSNQVTGSLEAGYTLPLSRAISVTPFANLGIGWVRQSGGTETGAGALDLSTQAISQSSVVSTLGGRFSLDLPVRRWLVTTNIQIGWAHEFASTDRHATSAFADTPSSAFTVAGASVARDSALVGVGVVTQLCKNSSLYVNYSGYFDGGTSSNAITGGLRYQW